MSAIAHAIDAEIEDQIRDLKRAIARRSDVDELVARLEERETMLARTRTETRKGAPRGSRASASVARRRG